EYTCTVAGLKLVPASVKLNCWPANGGFGVVPMLLSAGVGVPMVSGRVLEAVPLGPFCTETVRVPAVFSVAGPLMLVAVLLVSTPLGTVQGEQPGPLNST